MGYRGGELAPWFDTAPNDRAMRNMVRVGLRAANEIAIDNTPVDTGDLREDWQVTEHISRAVTFIGMGWEGSWFNDSEYADYVERGTGLYGPEHRKFLIVPKRPGGTLHWVDRVTGEDRFAKAVLHPGSPGQHMLAISANWLEATWRGLVRGVLRNWAREVAQQGDVNERV